MSENLVIIPTYNEKENIEKIIRKVFTLPFSFHLLVVDDGSPDGTAAIVKKLSAEYPGKLFLEERTGKSGLGTAYIHGFKWALKRNYYYYIYEMDADFSHNPDDLIRLHAACINSADVSIGSRYITGGKVENWSWDRILMSYLASWYVRIVLGIPVKDSTAGFKCYRRKVLETINLDAIRFVGYAFQIEMKYKALKAGFNVVEIPIKFTDRKEGVSKMNMSIFKEAFLGVIQMRMGK